MKSLITEIFETIYNYTNATWKSKHKVNVDQACELDISSTPAFHISRFAWWNVYSVIA